MVLFSKIIVIIAVLVDVLIYDGKDFQILD